MKKILSLILLSIFLISMVPLVFAEKQRDDIKPELVQDDKGNLIVKAEQREKVQVVKAKILEKIKDIQLKKVQEFTKLKQEEAFKKFKEKGLKAREITKEKLKEVKDRYKIAKTKFLDNKKRFLEKKGEIRELKKELKDLEGEEYIEKEKQLKIRIKYFLVDICDTVIGHLNMVKENIEGNEDLSEEEASELLADINSKIEEMEETKTKLEALSGESTKEEIKESAEGLQSGWNRVKQKVKKNVGRLMNARIGGIIVRSKQLENKLTKILERMAENDKDTSVVEPLVDEFNSKLDSAKEYYVEAREQFKNDLVQEGQKNMKLAHRSLKEANEVLKKIFSELKSQNMEKELEEVEVEEETEEEE